MTETYTGSQPSIALEALEQERIRLAELGEQARLTAETKASEFILSEVLKAVEGWKLEDFAWAEITTLEPAKGQWQATVVTSDGDVLIAPHDGSYQLRMPTGVDVSDKRAFADHVDEAGHQTEWATTTKAGNILRTTIDPTTGLVNVALVGPYSGREQPTGLPIERLSGRPLPDPGKYARQRKLNEQARLTAETEASGYILSEVVMAVGGWGWKLEDFAWAEITILEPAKGQWQATVVTADGDTLTATHDDSSRVYYRLTTPTGVDVSDKRAFAEQVGEASRQTEWATTTKAGNVLRTTIDPTTGLVNVTLESGASTFDTAPNTTIEHLSGQLPPAAGERTPLRQDLSDMHHAALRADLAGKQRDVANVFDYLIREAAPVEPAGWKPEDFAKIDTSKMRSEKRIDLTTLDGTVIRAYLKDPNGTRLRMETGDESAPLNVLVRANYAPLAKARADSIASDRAAQAERTLAAETLYAGLPESRRDQKEMLLLEEQRAALARLDKALALAETINREFNEQQEAQETEKRRTTRARLEYALLGSHPRSRISGWNPTYFTSIEIAKDGKSAALVMIDGTEMTLTYKDGAPVSIAMNTPSGTVDVSNKTEWAMATVAGKGPRRISGDVIGQHGNTLTHGKDPNLASGRAR